VTGSGSGRNHRLNASTSRNPGSAEARIAHERPSYLEWQCRSETPTDWCRETAHTEIWQKEFLSS
jgi:hypothetical protein